MIFSWKGPFRTISSPTLLWQAWGISTIISGCTKPHPISFWMDFRMEFLGSTTSLCQCLITRSFVLMSNAVHDFTGQWGEAERSVVSRVLVIELFKDGCYVFLFSSHWGCWLLWLLKNDGEWLGNYNCKVSSGPWDSCLWVPWTYICPGSSGSLESDLLL